MKNDPPELGTCPVCKRDDIRVVSSRLVDHLRPNGPDMVTHCTGSGKVPLIK